MSKKMLAAIKKESSAGAELIETDIPTPNPDEVLIKVKACSICGTDKHIYSWDKWAASRIKTPMIFGHECCGEVIEIGANVKSISIGDYISAETHIPCQHCFQCKTGNMHLCQNLVILGVDRDGIFAEYATIPEICCWKNEKSLPIEIASIQEPFGNAVYTVMDSNVSAKRIAIVGDGPIVAFACGIAKAMGANIIGINGRKMFETWYKIKNILDYKLVDPSPVISHTMPFKDIIKAMEMAVSLDVPTSKIILTMSQ